MKKGIFLPLSFLLFLCLSGSAQTTEWNFTSDQEGWVLYSNATGGASGGHLNYTITGTNPNIRYTYPTGVFINSSTYKYAIITFKNGSNVGTGRFIWLNNNTVLGQKDFSIIAKAGHY